LTSDRLRDRERFLARTHGITFWRGLGVRRLVVDRRLRRKRHGDLRMAFVKGMFRPKWA
jgi:hypothetical protein